MNSDEHEQRAARDNSVTSLPAICTSQRKAPSTRGTSSEKVCRITQTGKEAPLINGLSHQKIKVA